MHKKFFTNLLLIIVLNLLIKPFWIFKIDVEVQKAVGESAYGLYFVAFNLSTILYVFLDMGISNFNNKNIAQHQFLLQKHLGKITAIRGVFSIFYIFIVLLTALFLGWDAYKMYLLSFLIFNQILISFILYLRSNLSALLLFKTDSFLSVLDKVLMIIFVSFLLWGRDSSVPFQIEWLIYSQTVAYVITFLVALFFVLQKSGMIKVRFSRTFFLAFLKQSYPYALLIFLMSFYNRIDSVFINQLLPDKATSTISEFHTGAFQSGLYAKGYRILDGLSQFSYLFSVLLLPIFSKMIKEKEDINAFILFAFSLIIVPAIVIATSGVVFSKEIMGFLYTEEQLVTQQLFSILIPGFIAISSTYIFGTLLTANGSLKQLNIMAGAGIFINVIANLLLTPHFEAIGAATASLITQVFTAVAQILIATHIFKLRVNYLFIFKLIVFSGVSLAIAYWCRNHIETFGIGFMSAILLSTLVAFLSRILSVKSLFLILKEKA